MKDFEQIFQCATKRKGGEAQLQSLLPPIKSLEQVCSQTDDRILSIMTQCIFQAGFRWDVVDKKWPELNGETLFSIGPSGTMADVKQRKLRIVKHLYINNWKPFID